MTPVSVTSSFWQHLPKQIVPGSVSHRSMTTWTNRAWHNSSVLFDRAFDGGFSDDG